MARHSSIDKLPPEIRAEIARLREKSFTIDQILAALRTLDGAQDVSRSALGRHVQKLDQIGERIRRSREIADVLVRRLGDAPESRQARLNIELMHSVILDLLGGDDGEDVTLDAESAMFLGRAIKDLTAAQKADADATLRLRKQLAAEAEEKLKTMEKEGAKPGARGFDPETLRRVREEIYGIAP